MDTVLYFDKPLGWTSFNLVNRVRGVLSRHLGVKKLKVVYSKETPIKPIGVSDEILNKSKRIPGSISFVPSTAGLLIASEVVKDLINFL